MSGAELIAVLGVASSVISVIDACNRILLLVRGLRDGDLFADVAFQLPLLIKVIEDLGIPENNRDLDDPTAKALKRVLDGCKRQLDALDQLITSSAPAKPSSKLRRT